MDPNPQTTTAAFQNVAGAPVATEKEHELFFAALRAGDCECIKKTIEKYPDAVDWRDKEGYKALHIAAYFHNEVDTLLYLLNHSAEINDTGKDGFTALHHAVLGCSPIMIKPLLEHGANPCLKNDRGETALDLAKNICPAAVTTLLETAEVEYLQKEQERKKSARRKSFAIFTEGLPNNLRTKPSPFRLKKREALS